jgi:hypothetical protein
LIQAQESIFKVTAWTVEAEEEEEEEEEERYHQVSSSSFKDK